MEHLIRVRKKNFEQLMNGDLTCIIAKADRLFSTGDRLLLCETAGTEETGRTLTVRVTAIIGSADAVGISENYEVLCVKRSGKQTRTNCGNKPATADEAKEYASQLGKSAECAQRFFDYYSMTGWKMKNGIPLSDWKAALRNWKDYSANRPAADQQNEDAKLALLLPLLLKATARMAKKYHDIIFRDPFIGTVFSSYGFDRCENPFNAFEVREMIKKYKTARELNTGCSTMNTVSYDGQNTLTVPTIDEYEKILQTRKSKEKDLTK